MLRVLTYVSRTYSTTMAGTRALDGPLFSLDPFCFRQFDDETYRGTRVPFDKKEFLDKMHEVVTDLDSLAPGYAPFCKHIFVENFAGCKLNCIEITPENQMHLQSDYVARTEKELPVLSRWFPADKVVPTSAKYLDVILYSREQIREENVAMNEPPQDCTAPWGIIAIKAQDVDYELPMAPITMMRNALGKDQGGSGVPLIADEYQRSVDFWKKHAIIQ